MPRLLVAVLVLGVVAAATGESGEARGVSEKRERERRHARLAVPSAEGTLPSRPRNGPHTPALRLRLHGHTHATSYLRGWEVWSAPRAPLLSASLSLNVRSLSLLRPGASAARSPPVTATQPWRRSLLQVSV